MPEVGGDGMKRQGREDLGSRSESKPVNMGNSYTR
jgi:hypothetical protein